MQHVPKKTKTSTDNHVLKNPLVAECILSYSTGEYLFLGTVCKTWARNYGTDDSDSHKRTKASKVNSLSRIREVVRIREDDVDGPVKEFLVGVFLECIKKDDVVSCGLLLSKAGDALRGTHDTGAPLDFDSTIQAIEWGSLCMLKYLVGWHDFEVRYTHRVGRKHHPKSKAMMSWLVSQGMDLRWAYIEAIMYGSVENMDLLKELDVQFPLDMRMKAMRFARSREIRSWLLANV